MDELNRSTRRAGRWMPLLFAVSSALGSGCGGGGEVEKGLVPVNGRITLDGGSWPKPGQITFVPTNKGQGAGASRSAIASFGTDGSFEVIGGYGEAKGLHPGEYRVSVECLEGVPEMPVPGKKVEPVKNYAPKKDRDPETSGLSVKVADQPVEVSLNVQSK